MSVINLTKQNFENEVNASEKPVLIDFFADWCGPCRRVAPIIEEIAAELGEVKVCKVNVDEESELAARFSVMSIPTLIVVKNGEVVNKKIGAGSKEEIKGLL